MLYHLNLLFVILVIAFLPHTTIADCKNIRLDQDGGPFSKIPIYNQSKLNKDDPGICYAIGASSILDANRFYSGDKKLKQLSSPISIALYSNGAIADQVLEILKKYGQKTVNAASLLGSSPNKGADILNSINGKRLCDQRFLERYATIIDGSGYGDKKDGVSLEVFIDLFSKAREQVLTEIKLDANIGKLKFADTCRQIGNRRFLILGKILKSYSAEHSISEDALQYLSELCAKDNLIQTSRQAISYDGFTPEEKETLAGKRYSNKGFRSEFAISDIPKRLRMKANNILEAKNPSPIMISYNGTVLREKEISDLSIGGHVSVIIGQRPKKENPNECEFLVRDSYGRCETANPPYISCDNGSVWVDGDILFSKTDELTWIPR